MHQTIPRVACHWFTCQRARTLDITGAVRSNRFGDSVGATDASCGQMLRSMSVSGSPLSSTPTVPEPRQHSSSRPNRLGFDIRHHVSTNVQFKSIRCQATFRHLVDVCRTGRSALKRLVGQCTLLHADPVSQNGLIAYDAQNVECLSTLVHKCKPFFVPLVVGED